MVEYESVLTRNEHLAVSRLSLAEVAALLDSVARIAEPVRLAFLWRPMLPDPGDDMVLEVAVNGGADAIVTMNRRDFGPVVKSFAIEVLRPGEAAARLGAEQ
jgi:predicted nucleic acid-binding protein